jgi:GNAT superfamily N-acetyltransferase
VSERGAPRGIVMRPYDDSENDQNAAVAIWNTIWPDEPTSLEGLRYGNRTRSKDRLYRRVMVDLDGETVATAIYRSPGWSTDPGLYEVEIRVLPAYQRRGIGTALYEHVLGRLGELEQPPTKLASDAREDQPHSVKFLTDRGFELKQRQQVSRLDVASFDPAPFADVVEHFGRLGLVVKTLDEFEAADPEARSRMYEAYAEFFKDVPLFTDGFEFTREIFERELNAPNRLPGGILLAFDGDEIVGTTGLWKRLADPGALATGLTAVARSHRRRGIATALKVRAIEFARGLGTRAIHTDNEENNPMYDLNVRLGFRPTPAWLIFVKEVGTSEEPGRRPAGDAPAGTDGE